MGNTLFDQLKNAGLVDKNKANKIKKNKYKNKKQQSKKAAAQEDSAAQAQAKKQMAESAERDRKINKKIKDEADRKAVAAQIKQLIERHRIQDQGGDITYNFTDEGVVKHIYVSDQAYKLLMAGRIAVAKLQESYELVPQAVAEKIKQRDLDSVITADHDTESALDEDDPYADYAIPDDLMW